MEAFQQGMWGNEKISLGQRDDWQSWRHSHVGEIKQARPEQTGDRTGQGACWLAQQSCGQTGRMAEASLLETRSEEPEAANGEFVEGNTEHCEGGGAGKRGGRHKMQKGW